MTADILKIMTGTYILGFAATAFAVPAKPGVVDLMLDDGNVVPVRIVGDELAHSMFSEDGWPVIEKDGSLWFAECDAQGNLIPSAWPVAQRDDATESWLSSQDRETLTEAAYRRSRSRKFSAPARISPGLSESSFPSAGEPEALVILVQYSDISCTLDDPYGYFQRMLNEEEFGMYGATGSVRDYFTDNSDGQFRPRFDLYGPVTLPQPRAYYGANVNDFDIRPEEMAIDACRILDSEVDFSVYDHDGDGYIDNVFIFFAGRGENAGGGDNAVWPHSWDVRGARPDEVFEFDGVRLGHYACSNEWMGNMPDGIGTFIHEFSHVLGLPDLYATGEVTTGIYSPGAYSVLDTGPYNNNSRTPAGYSMFERFALGWTEPRVLDRADDIELKNLQHSNDGCIIRCPSNPDEYFLFENRQNNDWDRFIPGHGMIVWHVDFLQEIWDANVVNNNPVHQYVDLVEADGLPSWYNRDGDCFPGTAGVTEFTDSSMPSMRTWTGDVLDLPITDIEESPHGVISFKVAGGLVPSETPVPENPSDVGSYHFVARWNPVADAIRYEVKVCTDDREDMLYSVDNCGNDCSLTVDGIAPETLYRYYVRAWQRERGASPWSTETCVTTGDATFEWFAPEPDDPSDIDDSGFVARWKPLDNATAYFVSVFRKTGVMTETDTQDFSGGVEAISLGWKTTSEFVFGNSAYSGESIPALRFNSMGADLESPAYESDIVSLKLWHRGAAGSAGNDIAISALINGEWLHLTDISVTEEEGGRTDIVDTFPYGSKAVRIHYEGSGSRRGPVAIDDVAVTREISYERSTIDGLEMKPAGNNLDIRIDGLEPDTEYYHTIRASDGTAISKESIPIRIKTLPLGQSGASLLHDPTYDERWYDLQGIRIDNPLPGKIYIRIRDGKVTKTIVRD